MLVLVAYETAHGSTRETAETIADVLRELGAEVDVIRCRKVESVEGYDAVVVGAPIWFGGFLRPARTFLTTHAEALSEMPVAMFCASFSGAMEKYEKDVTEKYIPKVLKTAPSVEPVDFVSFAGVLNYPKYNVFMRQFVRALCGAGGGPTSGVTDFRDWDAIRAWATKVHGMLAEG